MTRLRSPSCVKRRRYEAGGGPARAVPIAIKGRGAADNRQGRFERQEREAFDDGWEREDEEQRGPRTEVTLTQARSIISRNDSPDIPFTQSINPYQGCEHGCIYCYARPSHAYLGLSPGLDFETKLFAKANAAQLLRAELSRPGISLRRHFASAPTPIRTSRSSANTGLRAASWKCWLSAITRWA